MKVWITGAKGHVGSALAERLGKKEYELFLTDKEECDITVLENVMAFAKEKQPDVIINCASLTDVETCQNNPDEAYKVNALGARNVAMASHEIHAKIIHMSTDDVFNRDTQVPYNEFDEISPCSLYGKSKAAGEELIEHLTNHFIIIRSSWIYGIGNDFVNTVLEEAEFGGAVYAATNRIASPTSAIELANTIEYFVNHDVYGTYHVVCPGECSRYEFAKTILEFSGKTGQMSVFPVELSNDMRPAYSCLDNMMLRISGIPEPKGWKEALKEYMVSKGFE